MLWQQLSVTAREKAAPLIAELLSSLGAVSVTFEDAADEPVYELKPGETQVWHHTKVTGLFAADADLAKIRNFLTPQLTDEVIGPWEQHDLEDQVWERAWMAHYHPMKFGGRLWVCPSGQEHSESGTVCLTLDPGLAFGTGTHPTTALCLEWLAENNVSKAQVVDYGCGSGILAVAALLLGAEHAYGIDIDPQALVATRDNAEKNGVGDRIGCFLPEQLPTVKADILLANILANPLIDLTLALAEHTAAGGRLVLSGLLCEQADGVAEAYAPYFDLDPPAHREEWVRLSGRRKA